MANDRCQPCKGASACLRGSGRQSGHRADKRGRNTKIHLAVDAHGMPLKPIVTSGTTADCTVAIELLGDFQAEYVLADKGYDSQAIIDYIEASGAKAVIPPRKNRKDQRDYDKHIYRVRHFGRECIFTLERVAIGSDSLRKKRQFLPCNCAYPLRFLLAEDLVTTRSSATPANKNSSRRIRAATHTARAS